MWSLISCSPSLKLSWSTLNTMYCVIVVLDMLYLGLGLPFRIGFYMDPVALRLFNKFNDKWTTEMTIFIVFDLLSDIWAAYRLYNLYQPENRLLKETLYNAASKREKRRRKEVNMSRLSSKTERQEWSARWTSRLLLPKTINGNTYLDKMSAPALTADLTPNLKINATKSSSSSTVLEIVGLLPLDVIAFILQRYQIIPVLRILKLARLYRVKTIWTNVQIVYGDTRIVQQLSLTGYGYLVATITIGACAAHWFACIYMLIGHISCGKTFDLCDYVYVSSWVIKDNLVGGTTVRKYGRTIYWATRTMVLLGYDDVTPVSDWETLYCLFVQLAGALFSTSLLATFLFIFHHRDKQSSKFLAHTDMARKFMLSHKVPQATQNRVLGYYRHLWDTYESLDSEAAIDYLPNHLKARAAATLKARRVIQVSFLTKEPLEVINSLARAVTNCVYLPRDIIVHPRRNTCMQFVIRGIVMIFTDIPRTTSDKTSLRQRFSMDVLWRKSRSAPLLKECCDGEFFADICLLSPELYEETAVAKTFCELYTLSKNSLDETLGKFYKGNEVQVRNRMLDIAVKNISQLGKIRLRLGLRNNPTLVKSNNAGGSKERNSDMQPIKTKLLLDNKTSFKQPDIEWHLPGSTFRNRWQTCSLLCVIYVAFEVPYYIAFQIALDSNSDSIQLNSAKLLSISIEIFFIAQCLLQARWFAYLHHATMIFVTHPTHIFQQYKNVDGMYWDVVSILPIAMILEFNVKHAPRIVTICSRLLRIFRIRKINTLLSEFVDRYALTSKAHLILALVLCVLLLLHWAGCVWFSITWQYVNKDAEEGGQSSYYAINVKEDMLSLSRNDCLQYATLFDNCTWLLYDSYGNIGSAVTLTYTDADGSWYVLSFAYLRSVYWAVVAFTGVGYGDITAFSTIECYFAALWIFAAGIFNFGVVAAMSHAITMLLETQRQHFEKLTTVNTLMEQLQLSESLRCQIREFYSHRYKIRDKLFESQMLSHLPNTLCVELSSLLHQDAVKKISLLMLHLQQATDREIVSSTSQARIIADIASKFRHKTHYKGDSLGCEGELCTQISVFTSGFADQSVFCCASPVGALNEGDTYGFVETILKCPHPATITCSSIVELAAMTSESIEEILHRYADALSGVKHDALIEQVQSSGRIQAIVDNLMHSSKLQSHVLNTLTFLSDINQTRLKKISSSKVTATYQFNEIQKYLLPQIVVEDKLNQVLFQYWELILLLSEIYNAFVIMLRLTFLSQLHYTTTTALILTISDISADLVYYLDIFLNLFYFHEEGSAMPIPKRLRQIYVNKTYLKSNRFFWDCLSSLPLHYINHDRPLLSGLCRIPRLVRVLDIPMQIDSLLIRLQHLFPKRQRYLTFLNPLKLLLLVLLTAHYAACIFFLVSEYECQFLSSTCWIHQDHFFVIYEKWWFLLYLRSFYWAFSTLTLGGTREIVPRSTYGTIWAIITCCCCTFVMGHVLGELSDQILALQKNVEEHKATVEKFSKFAQANELPISIRQRAAFYFQVMFDLGNGRNEEETEFYSDLPENLRIQLMLQKHGSLLGRVPIFKELTILHIKKIALKLSSEIFIPGDEILTENTPGDFLCILEIGNAIVSWEYKKSVLSHIGSEPTEFAYNVAILLPGTLFGEVSFFGNNQLRTATVRATTAAIVLKLPKRAWDRIWHDNVGKQAERHASSIRNVERLKRWEKYDMMHNIFNWILERIQFYKSSTLVLATRASSQLKQKEENNRANKRSKWSKISVQKILRKRTPSVLLKRAILGMTGQAQAYSRDDMILQSQARYVLTKAVYTVKVITRKQLSSNEKNNRNKLLGSTIMSLADQSSSRYSTLSRSETRPATNQAKNSRIYPFVPALSLSNCDSISAKHPTGHMKLGCKEGLIPINPIHKTVSHQFNTKNLKQFDTEVWDRLTSWCHIENTYKNMIQNLTNHRQLLVHFDKVSEQQLRATSISSVISIHHNLPNGFRKTPSFLSYLKGEKNRRFSIHTPRSNAFNYSSSRVGLQNMRSPQSITTSDKKQLNANINIGMGGIEPNVTQPVLKLSNMAWGVAGRNGLLPHLDIQSKFQFKKEDSSSAKGDTVALSSDATNLHLGILLKRSKSVPQFNNKYFLGVIWQSRQRDKISIGKNAHDNVLQKSITAQHRGLNFDVLQRCQQLKHPQLYRLYKNINFQIHKLTKQFSNRILPHPCTPFCRVSKAKRFKKPKSNHNYLRVIQSVRVHSTRENATEQGSTRGDIPIKSPVTPPEQTQLSNLNHKGMNSREFQHFVMKLQKLWAVIVLLCLFNYLIITPFDLSYGINITNSIEPPLENRSPQSQPHYVLADILCFIDVIYRVRSSVVASFFQYQVDTPKKNKFVARSHVARIEHKLANILQKISIILNIIYAENMYDVVALLPLELIFQSVSNVFGPVWRLNKLLYTRRTKDLMEEILQYVLYDLKPSNFSTLANETLWSYFFSILYYVLRGHWISCFWFGISAYNHSQSTPTHPSHSWILRSGMLYKAVYNKDNLHAPTELHQDTISMFRKYVRSMYFAAGTITTLAYGDISSSNLTEMLTEFVMIAISIYLYGALVGAQGSYLHLRWRDRADFEQRLSGLQHYVKHHDIPPEFKRQLKSYHASIWFFRRGQMSQFASISSLSKSLRHEIVLLTLDKLVACLPGFQRGDVQFLREFLPRLQYVICSRGEIVVSQGDLDRSMYFIHRGTFLLRSVTYTMQDKEDLNPLDNKDAANLITTQMQIGAGGFFGELPLLYAIPHPATCVAQRPSSEVYRLDHHAYEDLLLDFPEYRERNRVNWTIAGSTSTKNDKNKAMALDADDVHQLILGSSIYKSALNILAQSIGTIDPIEASGIIQKGKDAARRSITNSQNTLSRKREVASV